MNFVIFQFILSSYYTIIWRKKYYICILEYVLFHTFLWTKQEIKITYPKMCPIFCWKMLILKILLLVLLSRNAFYNQLLKNTISHVCYLYQFHKTNVIYVWNLSAVAMNRYYKRMQVVAHVVYLYNLISI